MDKKIGIIGYGNMGQAIAERIKGSYQVFVFDQAKDKTAHVSNISVTINLEELASKADILILAVKPQDFDAVLNGLKEDSQNKLIISIAAGITTGYIEKTLNKTRVIRAMPNVGAKIGKSVTCICKGISAGDKDLEIAKEIFAKIGQIQELSEDMMDSATAISGSGPAYIFYDLEIKKIDPHNIPETTKQGYINKLKEAAERVGFDPKVALALASGTTANSLDLVMTGLSPTELRKQVTSKGGTTEAALNILALGKTWAEAALAAKNRAKELSKGPAHSAG